MAGVDPRLGALLALALSLAAPQLALAQSGTSSDSKTGADDRSDGQELVEKRSEQSEKECRQTLPADRRGDPEQLIRAGVTCFRAGKHARAFTHYRRAEELERTPLMDAALGRSLHELGFYGLAQQRYRSFLEADAGSSSSRAKIRDRIDTLRLERENEGVRITIETHPSDAHVDIALPNGDWLDVGRTPAELTVRGGQYRLRIERDSFRTETFETRADARAGPLVVEKRLVSKESELRATARQWRRAGLFTGAAGLAVAAGSGVFFGLAADKIKTAEHLVLTEKADQRRQNRLLNEGHRLQRWGIGLAIAGGTALITGTILYIRGGNLPDSQRASDAESAKLRLRAGPARAGFALEW